MGTLGASKSKQKQKRLDIVMKYAWAGFAVLLVAGLGSILTFGQTSTHGTPARPTYYGFDLNSYPGDDSLSALRKSFAYVGYWLNVPPGAASNNWAGKRDMIEKAGFGFLVLFNGPLDAALKNGDASKLGEQDASTAAHAAEREGFPSKTVIFLDVEEGGRMLPEQKAYVYAWVDGVKAAGFQAGVYCSGIPAPEGHGITVVTAKDLREHAQGRSIVYWVANDACPPSPGCVIERKTLPPEESGVGFAEVWQFAQSPRRPEMTRRCRATYGADQNCYVQSEGQTGRVAVDMNTANEEDPSHGRTRARAR
jgi:hypothetical protein